MKKLALSILLPIAACAMLPQVAAAASCTVSRDEVQAMLANGADPVELSAKLEGCVAKEIYTATKTAFAPANAIGQNIKDTGSTFFEALTSCGYQPQRKELTCPIEIRQTFGFGGVPALQPAGSYEYVMFCVDSGAGLVPVNTNGVHVHDEAHGKVPNWYLSAVVPANQQLFNRPLRGHTLKARAILSWGLPPANCGFAPIWGNQADFRIRLDP